MKILEKIGLTTAPPHSPQVVLEKAIEHEVKCRVNENDAHEQFLIAKAADDALQDEPATEQLDFTTRRKVRKDHAKRKDATRAERIDRESYWQEQIEIRKKASKAVVQARAVLNHMAVVGKATAYLDGLLALQPLADEIFQIFAQDRNIDSNVTSPIVIISGPNGLTTGLAGALNQYLDNPPVMSAPKPKRALPPGQVTVHFVESTQVKREALGIQGYCIGERASFPEEQAWKMVAAGVAEVVSPDGAKAEVAQRPMKKASAPAQGMLTIRFIKSTAYSPFAHFVYASAGERMSFPASTAKTMIDAGIAEALDRAPATADEAA